MKFDVFLRGLDISDIDLAFHPADFFRVLVPGILEPFIEPFQHVLEGGFGMWGVIWLLLNYPDDFHQIFFRSFFEIHVQNLCPLFQDTDIPLYAGQAHALQAAIVPKAHDGCLVRIRNR